MGKIKKLHFDEINKWPQMGDTDLYPITHTDAVYDDNGDNLTTILKRLGNGGGGGNNDGSNEGGIPAYTLIFRFAHTPNSDKPELDVSYRGDIADIRGSIWRASDTSRTEGYTWMTCARYTFEGDWLTWDKEGEIVWMEPHTIGNTSSTSTTGTDSEVFNFIFGLSNSVPGEICAEYYRPTFSPDDIETSSTHSKEYRGILWTDHPSGVSPDQQYEYYCFSIKTTNGWSLYSVPMVWSHWGENGRDGDGYEYIFTVVPSKDLAPGEWTLYQGRIKGEGTEYVVALNDIETNEAYQSDDFIPINWYDDPQDVDEDMLYQYVSMRKKKYDENDNATTWGHFSTPVLWNSYNLIQVSNGYTVSLANDKWYIAEGTTTGIENLTRTLVEVYDSSNNELTYGNKNKQFEIVSVVCNGGLIDILKGNYDNNIISLSRKEGNTDPIVAGTVTINIIVYDSKVDSGQVKLQKNAFVIPTSGTVSYGLIISPNILSRYIDEQDNRYYVGDTVLTATAFSLDNGNYTLVPFNDKNYCIITSNDDDDDLSVRMTTVEGGENTLMFDVSSAWAIPPAESFKISLYIDKKLCDAETVNFVSSVKGDSAYSMTFSNPIANISKGVATLLSETDNTKKAEKTNALKLLTLNTITVKYGNQILPCYPLNSPSQAIDYPTKGRYYILRDIILADNSELDGTDVAYQIDANGDTTPQSYLVPGDDDAKTDGAIITGTSVTITADIYNDGRKVDTITQVQLIVVRDASYNLKVTPQSINVDYDHTAFLGSTNVDFSAFRINDDVSADIVTFDGRSTYIKIVYHPEGDSSEAAIREYKCGSIGLSLSIDIKTITSSPYKNDYFDCQLFVDDVLLDSATVRYNVRGQKGDDGVGSGKAVSAIVKNDYINLDDNTSSADVINVSKYSVTVKAGKDDLPFLGYCSSVGNPFSEESTEQGWKAISYMDVFLSSPTLSVVEDTKQDYSAHWHLTKSEDRDFNIGEDKLVYLVANIVIYYRYLDSDEETYITGLIEKVVNITIRDISAGAVFELHSIPLSIPVIYGGAEILYSTDIDFHAHSLFEGKSELLTLGIKYWVLNSSVKNASAKITGVLYIAGTATPTEAQRTFYLFSEDSEDWLDCETLDLAEQGAPGERGTSPYMLSLDNDSVIIDDNAKSDAVKTLTETSITLYNGEEEYTGEYTINVVDKSLQLSTLNANGSYFAYFTNSNDLRIGAYYVTYGAYVDGSLVATRTQTIDVVNISNGESYRLSLTPNIFSFDRDEEGNATVTGAGVKPSVAKFDTEWIDITNDVVVCQSIDSRTLEGTLCLVYPSGVSYSSGENEFSTSTYTVNGYTFQLYIITKSGYVLVDSETVDCAIPGKQGAPGPEGPKGLDSAILRVRGEWNSNGVVYQYNTPDSANGTIKYIDAVTYKGNLYIARKQHTSSTSDSGDEITNSEGVKFQALRHGTNDNWSLATNLGDIVTKNLIADAINTKSLNVKDLVVRDSDTDPLNIVAGMVGKTPSETSGLNSTNTGIANGVRIWAGTTGTSPAINTAPFRVYKDGKTVIGYKNGDVNWFNADGTFNLGSNHVSWNGSTLSVSGNITANVLTLLSGRSYAEMNFSTYLTNMGQPTNGTKVEPGEPVLYGTVNGESTHYLIPLLKLGSGSAGGYTYPSYNEINFLTSFNSSISQGQVTSFEDRFGGVSGYVPTSTGYITVGGNNIYPSNKNALLALINDNFVASTSGFCTPIYNLTAGTFSSETYKGYNGVAYRFACMSIEKIWDTINKPSNTFTDRNWFKVENLWAVLKVTYVNGIVDSIDAIGLVINDGYSTGVGCLFGVLTSLGASKLEAALSTIRNGNEEAAAMAFYAVLLENMTRYTNLTDNNRTDAPATIKLISTFIDEFGQYDDRWIDSNFNSGTLLPFDCYSTTGMGGSSGSSSGGNSSSGNTGGSSVTVIDSLTSSDTKAALSAKQGKILKGETDKLNNRLGGLSFVVCDTEEDYNDMSIDNNTLYIIIG